jgi:hypothetical protein
VGTLGCALLAVAGAETVTFSIAKDARRNKGISATSAEPAKEEGVSTAKTPRAPSLMGNE